MILVKEAFRYSDDGIHALVCPAGTYKEDELSEVALDYARRHCVTVPDVEVKDDSTGSVCKRSRAKSTGKDRRKQ